MPARPAAGRDRRPVPRPGPAPRPPQPAGAGPAGRRRRGRGPRRGHGGCRGGHAGQHLGCVQVAGVLGSLARSGRSASRSPRTACVNRGTANPEGRSNRSSAHHGGDVRHPACPARADQRPDQQARRTRPVAGACPAGPTSPTRCEPLRRRRRPTPADTVAEQKSSLPRATLSHAAAGPGHRDPPDAPRHVGAGPRRLPAACGGRARPPRLHEPADPARHPDQGRQRRQRARADLRRRQQRPARPQRGDRRSTPAPTPSWAIPCRHRCRSSSPGDADSAPGGGAARAPRPAPRAAPSARTSSSTPTPCGASPGWPASGRVTTSSRSAPASAR